MAAGPWKGADRRDLMIAALYVQRGGVYWDLPGVDPWDEARDARLYAGPWPVVAHPPCARWCRLAGLVEKRWGHKKGDDGGCFSSALAAVRKWGGVLEHPAWSDAWSAHDLPHPDPAGGWQGDLHGGWCCHVEQRWYGHRARKATWLYSVHLELPALRWGRGPSPVAWATTKLGRRGDGSVSVRPSVVKPMEQEERSATPLEFRDILIAMARSSTVMVP